MSRYRLVPTPAQEAILRGHCAHARFVWNLAVEQRAHWCPGRAGAPGYLEQCRQLTAARAEHPWLAAGSYTVQQQALRDFAQAMAAFFNPGNPAGRPSWRKAGRDEGFRIVGRRGRQWDVRRLSRRVGEVWVPKAGWVRFRWSRAVPMGVKSYRVTMDPAGRWHVAFAAIPDPVPAPGNEQAVGIDRGVAVSAALSTGELLHFQALKARERTRLRRLERKLARARRGSKRRRRVTLAMARLRARETDRRKDWVEKTSTVIARGFDVIRVEELQISNMTRSGRGTREHPGRNVRAKATLNRGILRSGWGLLVRRLEQKAPGRVQKVKPHYTSQRCSACGQVDPKSRESQAVFQCTACGYADHADVNAAKNIAAGHAVTARGGDGVTRPVNREPQLLASLTGCQWLESPPSLQAWEDANEVSSYQATDLPCSPPEVAVTSPHPNHMDWRGGWSGTKGPAVRLLEPGRRAHAPRCSARGSGGSPSSRTSRAGWMDPLGLIGPRNLRNALIARRGGVLLGEAGRDRAAVPGRAQLRPIQGLPRPGRGLRPRGPRPVLTPSAVAARRCPSGAGFSGHDDGELVRSDQFF